MECGKFSDTPDDKRLLELIDAADCEITRVLCSQCSKNHEVDLTYEQALIVLELKGQYEGQ